MCMGPSITLGRVLVSYVHSNISLSLHFPWCLLALCELAKGELNIKILIWA